jgi:aminoglycoside phosphotransferase (APT) family kinase protein
VEAKADTAERLLVELREHTRQPALTYRGQPGVLSGGYYAELLAFELSDPPPELAGPLVARIVPNADTGRWEAAVQGAVAAATDDPPLTPRVRTTIDRRGALGRHVTVMDLAPGQPPFSGFGLASMLTKAPRLLRQLPATLAEVSLRLHAIDPLPVQAELAALHLPHALSTTELATALGRSAQEQGAAELARAADRLLATAPPTTLLVVGHGDLHPLNLLLGDGPPVLIDWSNALIAHPAFDLAYTELILANPPISLPRPFGAALRSRVQRMAQRFLEQYARGSPHPADELGGEVLAWHRRLHVLRILVELDGWRQTDPEKAAGHPWTTIEPALRPELGLPEGAP